jgi:hypothetical protein
VLEHHFAHVPTLVMGLITVHSNLTVVDAVLWNRVRTTQLVRPNRVTGTKPLLNVLNNA